MSEFRTDWRNNWTTWLLRPEWSLYEDWSEVHRPAVQWWTFSDQPNKAGGHCPVLLLGWRLWLRVVSSQCASDGTVLSRPTSIPLDPCHDLTLVRGPGWQLSYEADLAGLIVRVMVVNW